MMAQLKRFCFWLLRLICTANAKRLVANYGDRFTVNYPCQFTRQTHVGHHCHFNGMRVIGAGRLTVGDYFHSGSDILVLTQNHNWREPKTLPYDDQDIRRNVTIGRYCWIGSRVILLPGCELGDGCIVQAGAVVHGKRPANAVLGGNPAQIIAMRDSAAVDRLVASSAFLP